MDLVTDDDDDDDDDEELLLLLLLLLFLHSLLLFLLLPPLVVFSFKTFFQLSTISSTNSFGFTATSPGLSQSDSCVTGPLHLGHFLFLSS